MPLFVSAFIEEVYEFDQDTDEYGDLFIFEVVDEVLEVENKLINNYAIVLPSMDNRDIKLSSAKCLESNGGCDVEILHPSSRHGFKNNYDTPKGWKAVMNKVKGKNKANKFAMTFIGVMTRIKKAKHTKRVVVTFPHPVSNEFLSSGLPHPDGSLARLPIPCVYEHEVVSKKTRKTSLFKSTETIIVW